MKDMDLFGKSEKTNREKRINSLLGDAEICNSCVLKDALCDCEHCDEANNKREEEDLKDSGFVDEEEIEELDDLDRLDEFEKDELLRINIWFPEGKVKPMDCLDNISTGTKLSGLSIRISEKAPWHWSFILENSSQLAETELVELRGVIEERMTNLSKEESIKLGRFTLGNYKSDYL